MNNGVNSQRTFDARENELHDCDRADKIDVHRRDDHGGARGGEGRGRCALLLRLETHPDSRAVCDERRHRARREVARAPRSAAPPAREAHRELLVSVRAEVHCARAPEVGFRVDKMHDDAVRRLGAHLERRRARAQRALARELRSIRCALAQQLPALVHQHGEGRVVRAAQALGHECVRRRRRDERGWAAQHVRERCARRSELEHREEVRLQRGGAPRRVAGRGAGRGAGDADGGVDRRRRGAKER